MPRASAGTACGAGCGLLVRRRSREAGCGSSPGLRQLPRSTMVCARVAPWRGACYGQGEETATCGFSHPAWPLPVQGLRAVWKCATSEDHLTCETNARKCRWRSVRASVGRENWCHHYLARQQDAGAAAGRREWVAAPPSAHPWLSTPRTVDLDCAEGGGGGLGTSTGRATHVPGTSRARGGSLGVQGGCNPSPLPHIPIYYTHTYPLSTHPTPHCSRIRVATLLVQCTRVPVWVNVGSNKLTSGQKQLGMDE